MQRGGWNQKRCMFRVRLKASTVGGLWIDRGRLFQSSEPKLLNDRSPTVLWVSGVLRRVVSIDERSPSLAGTYTLTQSQR